MTRDEFAQKLLTVELLFHLMPTFRWNVPYQDENENWFNSEWWWFYVPLPYDCGMRGSVYPVIYWGA